MQDAEKTLRALNMLILLFHFTSNIWCSPKRIMLFWTLPCEALTLLGPCMWAETVIIVAKTLLLFWMHVLGNPPWFLFFFFWQMQSGCRQKHFYLIQLFLIKLLRFDLLMPWVGIQCIQIKSNLIGDGNKSQNLNFAIYQYQICHISGPQF